jgi:adenylate cyclase
MKNRGTIDKYMGDAMMAFWNAPLNDPDHARHACKAALGMQAALDPVNNMLASRAAANNTQPVSLRAGIGINTGVGAVGNMGSKQRFAYSVLGDVVNLASRLESQTKTYGVSIIIGEETFNAVPDFAVLEADIIKVIGRAKPVRIFILLGDEALAGQKEFLNLKRMHKEMIGAYRAGEFKKAYDLAKECRRSQEYGLEDFYDLYVSRIDDLLKNPPSSWDGIYVALNK